MWPFRLESTLGGRNSAGIYVCMEKGVRTAWEKLADESEVGDEVYLEDFVGGFVGCLLLLGFLTEGRWDGMGGGCGRTWRMGLPFAMPVLMRTVGSPWMVRTSAQTRWRSEVLEMSRW